MSVGVFQTGLYLVVQLAMDHADELTLNLDDQRIRNATFILINAVYNITSLARAERTHHRY